MRCFDRKVRKATDHNAVYWDAHEGEFITYAYEKLEQERDEWRADANALSLELECLFDYVDETDIPESSRDAVDNHAALVDKYNQSQNGNGKEE